MLFFNELLQHSEIGKDEKAVHYSVASLQDNVEIPARITSAISCEVIILYIYIHTYIIYKSSIKGTPLFYLYNGLSPRRNEQNL